MNLSAFAQADAATIGLVSQSGALGNALSQAAECGIPFSHRLTAGNSCDVDVADLVAYRLRQEPLVKPLDVQDRSSQWGPLRVHHFQSLLDGGRHLAFVLGDRAGAEPPLVRGQGETLPEDRHGFADGR